MSSDNYNVDTFKNLQYTSKNPADDNLHLFSHVTLLIEVRGNTDKMRKWFLW